MAYNGDNSSGLQKKDSGCWDAKTDIGSCSEDETHINFNPSPRPYDFSPAIIPTNDFLIEPYEMDIEAAVSGKDNEAYVKSESDNDLGIFMTPESGKPNEDKYIRKNSVTNSIIGGNLGATGDKGSCKSVTSIMIPPSLINAESKSSLISGENNNRHDCPGGAKKEGWTLMMRDITIPFLIAGLGMVGAGVLLDHVLKWEVYKDLPELIVLVTPFLGLKGNLEMTLASRLSTQANIGTMNNKREKWRVCFGNLALDQLQAIVCGLVASFFALAMNYFNTGEWPVKHILLLTSASIVTGSLVSVVLGSVMVAVILLSRRYNMNPDNIATPVAGSLGDVVTLYILSTVASFIWGGFIDGGDYWIAYAIYGVYLIIVPVTFVIVYKNEYVKKVLVSGWAPVLISVLISTGAGILLDIAGSQFDNLALYQPLINGIGGNLVSVQASRIATQLHSECDKKVLPNNGRVCQAPWSVFTKGVHAISAGVLLFLTVPGHTLFVTMVYFIRLYPAAYDFIFLGVFLIAALVQVWILLYFAKILSNLMWHIGGDPDVHCIPFLTAAGDLIGTGVLFLAFLVRGLFG